MKKNKLTILLVTIIVILLGYIVFSNMNWTKKGHYFPLKTSDTLRSFVSDEYLINAGDFSSKLIPYWRDNYLKHKHRLTYNPNYKDSTIQGFRIEKAYLDTLFDKNDGINMLYVFFGAEKPNGKISLIFGELDTILVKVGSTQTRIDTTLSFTKLYEYVDSCPDKCPTNLKY